MTEPGGVLIRRDYETGTRTVMHADPVIRVSTAYLAGGNLDADVVERDGTLRLDTAGEYRYRFVRHESAHVDIYERITSGDTSHSVDDQH